MGHTVRHYDTQNVLMHMQQRMTGPCLKNPYEIGPQLRKSVCNNPSFLTNQGFSEKQVI